MLLHLLPDIGDVHALGRETSKMLLLSSLIEIERV